MALTDFVLSGQTNRIIIGATKAVGLAIGALTTLSNPLPAIRVQDSTGTTYFEISTKGAIGVGNPRSFGSSGDCLKSGGSSGSVMTWGTCPTSSTLDSRYVNVDGDTMTGALNIQLGNAATATANVLFNTRGTMSGKSIYVSGTGSQPMFMTNLGRGNVGIGTSTPKAKLGVSGTVSGSAITVGHGTSFVLGNLGIGTTSTAGATNEMVVANNKYIRWLPTAGNSAAFITLTSGNQFHVGNTAYSSFFRGINNYYYGNTHYIASAGGATYSYHDSSVFSPSSDNTISLGTLTTRWKNAFFSGNVGIGVTSPFSIQTQLHVAGATSLTTAATYNSLSNGKDIFVRGHYAYIVDEGTESLVILDISDKQNPSLVSSTVLSANDPYSIDVQGKYAYITLRSTPTLQVLDISNPNSPTSAGTFATADTPYGIAVRGNYAYIAEAGKLEIVDVSSPSSMIQASSLVQSSVAVTASDVVLSGDKAFMVSGTSIDAINVSSPSSPSIISTLGGGSDYTRAYLEGKYLFVVDEGASISSIDVANPASMFALTNETSYSYTTVFAQGQRVFGLGSGGGCDMLDYSSPTSLSLLGTGCSLSGGSSMWVEGRYWYILDGSVNLTIYEIGGAYIQQIQAGGIEAGTISALGEIRGRNGNFLGSINIGNNLFVANDVGIRGALEAGSLTVSTSMNLPYVTASAVLYANASKNVTSSSNFVFNGTNIGIGTAAQIVARLTVQPPSATTAALALRTPTSGPYTGNQLEFWNASAQTISSFSQSGWLAIGGNGRKARTQLDILGTMSGRTLYVSNSGSVLGNLGIGKTITKAKLDVLGTISGSLLTQNGAGTNYFIGNLGIGRTTANTKLEVLGTMSGTAVTVSKGGAYINAAVCYLASGNFGHCTTSDASNCGCTAN